MKGQYTHYLIVSDDSARITSRYDWQTYTYEDDEIDETIDHEATISDMVERHPQYFAKRISPDGSEFVIKGDWTFDELKAMPNTIKKFTNEQVKEYIAENWVITPTMDNTKAEIKAYMDENGIEYNSGDTKQDLLTKIAQS